MALVTNLDTAQTRNGRSGAATLASWERPGDTTAYSAGDVVSAYSGESGALVFPGVGVNGARSSSPTPGNDGVGTPAGNEPTVSFQEQGSVIDDSMLTGTHDVAVFDINNDGWLDLVIGRCTGTQRSSLPCGSGRISATIDRVTGGGGSQPAED